MYWSKSEKEWMNARGVNASFLESIGEQVELTAKLVENREFWKVEKGDIVPGDGQPHPIKETSFVEADGCQMEKGGWKLPAFEGGRLEAGRLLAKYETEMKEQGARHKTKIKALKPSVLPKRSDVFMESAPMPVHPLDRVKVIEDGRILYMTEQERLVRKADAAAAIKVRNEIAAGTRKPRRIKARGTDSNSFIRYKGEGKMIRKEVKGQVIRRPVYEGFDPQAGEKLPSSSEVYRLGKPWRDEVLYGAAGHTPIDDMLKQVAERSSVIGIECEWDWYRLVPEVKAKDLSYPHGPLITWKGGDLWKIRHAKHQYRKVSIDQLYGKFFAELEGGGDFIEPDWAIQPGSDPWGQLIAEHETRIAQIKQAFWIDAVESLRSTMKPLHWRLLVGTAEGLTSLELAKQEKKKPGTVREMVSQIRKKLTAPGVSAKS